MNLIESWKSALKGNCQLWRVFWLGNFLAYFILVGLVGIISLLTDGADAFLVSTATLLFLIYLVFVLYALWKCAFNVENKIYGYLARIYVVLAFITYVIGMVTIPMALVG